MATSNPGFVRDPSGPQQAGPAAQYPTERRMPGEYEWLGTVSPFITAGVQAATDKPGLDKNALLNSYSQEQESLRQSRDQGAINAREYEARARTLHSQWQGQFGFIRNELDNVYSGFQTRDAFGAGTIAMQTGATNAQENLAQKAVEQGLIPMWATPEQTFAAVDSLQVLNRQAAEMAMAAQQYQNQSSMSDVQRKDYEFNMKTKANDLLTSVTTNGLRSLTTIYQKYANGDLNEQQAVQELNVLRQQSRMAATQFIQFGDSGVRSALVSQFDNSANEIEQFITGKQAVDILGYQRQKMVETETVRILGADRELLQLSAINKAMPQVSGQIPPAQAQAIFARYFASKDANGNIVPGELNSMNREFANGMSRYIGQSVAGFTGGTANQADREAFAINLEQIGLAAGNTKGVNPTTLTPIVRSLSTPEAGVVLRQLPLSQAARNGLAELVTVSFTNTVNDQTRAYLESAVPYGEQAVQFFDAIDFEGGENGLVMEFGNQYIQEDGDGVFRYPRMKAMQDSMNQTIQFYANIEGTTWKEAANRYGYQVNPLIFPPPQIAAGGTFRGKDGKTYRWNGRYPFADTSNYEVVNGNR